MAPSLYDLPAPLPLAILKNIPDLKALHAAVRSCSLLRVVFSDHAAEVFESVATSSVLPSVLHELRIYTLLLEGIGPELVRLKAQKPLPRSISSTNILRTLRMNHQLLDICHLIMSKKLDRLYALPHERLADRKTDLRSLSFDTAGITYRIPDVAPPYFDEEQRFLRFVWWWQLKKSSPTVLPFCADWRSDLQGIEEQFLLDLKDIRIEIDWNPPATIFSSRGYATRNHRASKQTWEHANESIHQHTYGVSCISRAFYHTSSPLCKADSSILHRLGFYIWSKRRVRRLKLDLRRVVVDGRLQHEYSPYNEASHLFTWHKLYHAEMDYRRTLGENLPKRCGPYCWLTE